MNNHHPTYLRHLFSKSLLLLLLFVALPATAQEKLTVERMYLDMGNANGQLAEVLKYKEKDNRKEQPGLVIVHIAAENATFEGVILNEPENRHRNPGEYWLVMANGSRDFKIFVEGYTPLEVDFRNYNFQRIESGKTYILEVNVPQKGLNYDITKQERFSIKVSPAKSVLWLNGMKQELNSRGEVDLDISQGHYTYTIKASGYHDKVGEFDVSDDKKSNSLTVKLEPIKTEDSSNTPPSSTVGDDSGSTSDLQSYKSCPDGNHPHLIDLGLPSGTKWACCNVGASKPEGYGDYYAWGETSTKSSYDWSNYKHCDGSSDNCHNLGSSICGTQYDVAHVKWGKTWRMPTLDDMKELLDKCNKGEWTTQNGVKGRRFTGPNGASIFLPAAGYRNGSSLSDDGSNGNYWSGTQSTSNSSSACEFYFDSGLAVWSNYNRRYGQSVRPVAR